MEAPHTQDRRGDFDGRQVPVDATAAVTTRK